jgi:phospholipase/lecithinase/hemolysin
LQALYEMGARNFLITSITPLGCLPRVLAVKRGPKDEHGCLKAYNEISDLHTTGLLAEIKSLRRNYPDGRFTFLDYNAVFKHIQQNSADFGINPKP